MFHDLKISTRLALGFSVLVLLIMATGALSLFKAAAVGDSFHLVLADRYPTIATLHGLKDNLNLVARGMRNILIVPDPAVVRKEVDRIDTTRQDSVRRLQQLAGNDMTPEGRALLDKLSAARDRYAPVQERFMKLATGGQVDEAKGLLLAELRDVQTAYFAALDEFSTLEEGLMATGETQALADLASLRLSAWLSAALGVGVGLGLAVWITRAVTGPLTRAVAVARAVAAGDLSQRFDASGRNETAQLLAALKAMQDGLASMVVQVRGDAEGVATASAQIAQGTGDLSSRTEQGASALEETAAAMEQLGATVRQNADNAQQADRLSQGASAVAVRGGEAVARVVETMKGINDSSKQIADIVGVIDGIAFQTNILALNAAVEAARAGEQGRGFAVVAAEVRSLAQRSATAAREIKRLIAHSVERVEHGAALVDDAGTTMSEVVAAIRRATDLIGEISSASSQQATGVAQVGEAVGQLDQTMQQNAALVEQSAAAADSLRQQAQDLVKTVSVFRLGGAQPA
jgi:methyl-accepting chemotaxis protein